MRREAFEHPTYLEVGRGGGQPVLVDFDGDRQLDLAVAPLDEPGVFLLRNRVRRFGAAQAIDATPRLRVEKNANGKLIAIGLTRILLATDDTENQRGRWRRHAGDASGARILDSPATSTGRD